MNNNQYKMIKALLLAIVLHLHAILCFLLLCFGGWSLLDLYMIPAVILAFGSLVYLIVEMILGQSD